MPVLVCSLSADQMITATYENYTIEAPFLYGPMSYTIWNSLVSSLHSTSFIWRKKCFHHLSINRRGQCVKWYVSMVLLRRYIHFHFGYTPYRAVVARRRFGRTCFLHLKGWKNLLQVGTEMHKVKTWLPFGLNCFSPIDRGSMFLRNVCANAQHCQNPKDYRPILNILVPGELVEDFWSWAQYGPKSNSMFPSCRLLLH